MTACRIDSNRGFTLVELVIAVGITATISASLVLVLKSTIDAKITIESEARARRLGPEIIKIISADLRNAWAIGPDEEIEIRGSFFRLESKGSDDEGEDEMWFVTSVDSYMSIKGVRSDLTEVGYFLVENPDNHPRPGLKSLYRREDFSVDGRPDEGGKGIRLHDGVVSFNIWAYELPRDAVDENGRIDPAALEGLVTPGSEAEKEEWDSTEGESLPFAVRFELILDVTPTDAYNRSKKRRFGYYQGMARLPGFPELKGGFTLFLAEGLNIGGPENEQPDPAPNPNPNPPPPGE